ncbi:MAG: ferrous iron transport protein B [Synergistaceae bacterium]|nr:ferrous iron transport protein B [Synergistaceae bacterium]MBP9975983.1 ferrous iron transport protein B [Synergistaceae bacterium]
MKIALLGNPNCGKTTMFNAVTGSTQYVGNWPGVTVEKKEGPIRGHKDALLVDLPGIYSLSPYTLEERITRNYLTTDKPDAVINIVDSTNIERGLYLTTELLEMDVPIIIALNMTDAAEKAGINIDAGKLSKSLGCRVVKTSASEGTGIEDLVKNTIDIASLKERPGSYPRFSRSTEDTLEMISLAASKFSGDLPKRWFSVNLFSRDPILRQLLPLEEGDMNEIEDLIKSCEESNDDDSESMIANERYTYIDGILKGTVMKRGAEGLSVSDRIDMVLTNRLLGLPIFFMIMWGIYYISIQTLGDMTIGWTETLFGTISEKVSALLSSANVAEWLHALIINGVIGGVGSVLGFVPQLMILFLLISFLEDCGYMARVAFIMDRIFRQFGLSGKSFIPMLVGTGCSVPGIMASRTIENESDRRLTIILTPFVPCGAKLPVFALFAAAFFPEQSWVAPSMYMIGIGMVILSGIILKKTDLFGGEPAPFVMELPSYRMPKIKGVLTHMWERSKAFIVKAGTVIFFAAGLIWFLQAFSWSLQMVGPDESILASIGSLIAPIFQPLGFGNWQSAVAVVTGFLAKEAVVSTYGVLLGVGETLEDDPMLISRISQMFTPVSAYSFMVFTLLAPPCFAALGAIRSEMRSWKWTFFAIAWQTGLAYMVSMLIYQFGGLFFEGKEVSEMATVVIGSLVILAMGYSLYRMIKNSVSGKCACGGNCARCGAAKAGHSK